MKDASKKPQKINILDVVVVLIVATIISFFVIREVSWFIGGTTLVLGGIYLVLVWDDIVIWLATRNK